MSPSDNESKPTIEDRKRELARRLSLLVDALTPESGRSTVYRDLAAALKEQGISLSRERWNYMLAGDGALVSDPELFDGISSYYKVDPNYLSVWGEAKLPASIEAQLDFVKTMRVNRITEFAARNVGGEMSDDVRRAITELVRQQVETNLDS